MIAPGIYKHYKGGEYKVLFTALDKDANEIMVVYESVIYGTYYVRSLADFTDVVEVNGLEVPRYVKQA